MLRRTLLVAPASQPLATSVRKRERKELTLRRRFWTDRTRDLHALLDTQESCGDDEQAFWNWLVHRAPAEFRERIFRRLRSLAEEKESNDAALRAELSAKRKAEREVQREQEDAAAALRAQLPPRSPRKACASWRMKPAPRVRLAPRVNEERQEEFIELVNDPGFMELLEEATKDPRSKAAHVHCSRVSARSNACSNWAAAAVLPVHTTTNIKHKTKLGKHKAKLGPPVDSTNTKRHKLDMYPWVMN